MEESLGKKAVSKRRVNWLWGSKGGGEDLFTCKSSGGVHLFW